MGQINRTSKSGIDLIKGFEGLRRRSDRLPNGGWIVGYGHTRSAREGVEVTEREAEYLLRYDLREVEDFVAKKVHAPLNQNEFDALVSFCWNVGQDAFEQSDVLNYVNAGEMLAAAESFSAWRKARIGGRLIVVDALVRRRSAEKNLFLSHPNGPPAAPSLVVKPELDLAASVLALSEGALSIEARMSAPATRSANAELPHLVANDQFANYNFAGKDLAASETSKASAFVDVGLDPAETQAESAAEIGDVWDEDEAEDLDDAADYEAEAAEVFADDEASDFHDEIEADDRDDDLADDEQSADLARVMAAANLTASSDMLTLELAEAHDEDEETPGDVFVEVEEIEFEPPVDDAAEVFTVSELVDLADEADSDPVMVADETSFDLGKEFRGDDAPAEGLTTTNEGTVWSEPDALVSDVAQDLVEEETQRQKIVIDDVELPNGMTQEELDHYELTNGLPGSGHREKKAGFWGILPFLVLAVIGAVMVGLGVFDWWNLIKADQPVNESELYEGPFMTLIGGFGLVFGLYFTFRKMFVREG